MSSIFVDNLLTRLNRYKRDVELKEILFDKGWILWDEQFNQHQYLFLRDGKLILSFNGKVEEGSWSILPTNQIYIKKSSGKLLLNFDLLFDSVILILKVSGPKGDPFVLYDNIKIPDGDLFGYLDKFEESKRIQVKIQIESEKRDKKNNRVGILIGCLLVIIGLIIIILDYIN